MPKAYCNKAVLTETEGELTGLLMALRLVLMFFFGTRPLLF